MLATIALISLAVFVLSRCLYLNSRDNGASATRSAFHVLAMLVIISAAVWAAVVTLNHLG